MPSLIDAARALLGIPLPANPPTAPDLSELQHVRDALGGQLQPPTVSKLRWFQSDLESAQLAADYGDLYLLGQLWRAMQRDGLISGLLKTRTGGLIALPQRWRGDERAISALRAENGTRSLFDEMFPAAELAQLAADGIGLGVGIAELVRIPGRAHPVMVRLAPEFLVYRWAESRWYYRSAVGTVPVTPGDGRWILHLPGGILSPWNSGQWPALGRAYVDKEHAILHRGNYSGKLANPARVAYAPNGATEEQRTGFLAKLIAWGINTVFELPPGWEAKLLESNGRGWEVFQQQIDGANLEIMIALAGQVVTVTGGTGFANASIHETIRANLIKETADALAHTLNTQAIPPWEVQTFGGEVLQNTARISWDIAPPVDRAAEAESMSKVADAISRLTEVLQGAGMAPDVTEIVQRFGVPVVAAKVRSIRSVTSEKAA